MTKKEAAKIVAFLAAAYQNARVSVETSEVYENLLQDLDFETAKRACARLISTSKFLPTIAEIREAATDLKLGPMRTGGEAWGEAMMAVRKYDRSESPKWSEPIMAEAMRLWGSWVDFCNSPADDPGGRARFIELYEQLSKRQRVDVVSGIALPAPSAPLRLVGHDGKRTDRAAHEGPRRLAGDGTESNRAHPVPAVPVAAAAATAGGANHRAGVSAPVPVGADHHVRHGDRPAAGLSPRREWKRYTPEEIEAEMGAL